MHRADNFVGPGGLSFSISSAYFCSCLFLAVVFFFVIWLLARLDPDAPAEPHIAVHGYLSAMHEKVKGHIRNHFNGRR